MQADLFITLSNRDCKHLYGDNSASRFKVCLDDYIDFADHYRSCALLDFACTTQDIGNQVRNVYIYCNVTAEQRVGGRWESLLRYTTVRRNRYQLEQFAHPYYIPLKSIRGNYLEIYIRDENGQEVSFLKGTTRCTLHLKQ